ncbi:MAG: hypothetical protein LBI45_01855 [Bacteroidales bacterium]|jgi:hypothetical protein|nr:hypothetical protein [Bacteroidales bacterium]
MTCSNIVKPVFSAFLLFCLTSIFAQNNRLTNEKGQLLWQYTQNVSIDEVNPKDIKISLIFINGIQQTAISLRQELFHSQIEWLSTVNLQIEKEGQVEYVTVNLAPNQYMIFNYVIKNKKNNKELLLEKSALLIMNENFEVRKELIPEQRFEKQ